MSGPAGAIPPSDADLEAQARLAGHLAHKLGNLATVILGNLQMVAEDVAAGQPPAPSMVERSLNAARRVERLALHLRAFARPPETAGGPVDLGALAGGPGGGPFADVDAGTVRACVALLTEWNEAGQGVPLLAAAAGGRARLTAVFPGPNPSAEGVERIFEPLFLAADGTERPGLAPVWSLVGRAGGKVSAENDGEATFVHLDFPLAAGER